MTSPFSINFTARIAERLNRKRKTAQSRQVCNIQIFPHFVSQVFHKITHSSFFSIDEFLIMERFSAYPPHTQRERRCPAQFIFRFQFHIETHVPLREQAKHCRSGTRQSSSVFSSLRSSNKPLRRHDRGKRSWNLSAFYPGR